MSSDVEFYLKILYTVIESVQEAKWRRLKETLICIAWRFRHQTIPISILTKKYLKHKDKYALIINKINNFYQLVLCTIEKDHMQCSKLVRKVDKIADKLKKYGVEHVKIVKNL